MAKTLQEFSGEELTTISAADLIAALGGMGEAVIKQDGFYSKEWAEMVEAMPKVPVVIPTPENWRSEKPYHFGFQVNGMNMEVEGDKLTMVPLVFYEVWRNKVEGDALMRRHRAAGAANLSPGHINNVPHY